MSVELNMMEQILKEIFNIDQPEAYAEEGEETEEDILADVSQEDKQLLFEDTMKFFEKLYGEYVEETPASEYTESADYTEEAYTEESESYEEIPEGTEETYTEEY